MKLASRGKRLAAGLIDAIIPFVAYIVMVSVFGISSMLPGRGYGYGDPFGYGYGYGNNFDYNIPHSDSAFAAVLVLFILMMAYIIAELVLYARAQSIGKAILGLQVVSSKNGKPFRFWMMMLREFIVKSASSYVFLLGYIWILIDDKNRGWHDKILDSYVVDLKETANMYQRAAAAAQPITPKYEEKTDTHEEIADSPVVEEIKAEEPKPVIQEITDKVEALEAPEKVELLEASETQDVRAETEENISAAGDEQTEISVKEDDTEIK